LKDPDAIAVTDFIRLRKEGYVPNRDIIPALTRMKRAESRTAWIGCCKNIAI